jgi:hypothetical protein
MKQTILTKWMEEAEARTVRELAIAEPNLVKSSVLSPNPRPGTTKLRQTVFFSRVTRHPAPLGRVRSAA